jgi:hypothetical protein
MAAQEVKTAQTTSVAKDASLSGSRTNQTTLSAEDLNRMIAVAAYYKAERRGFAAGSELQDWLEAEQELAGTLDTGPAAASAAARAGEQKTQLRI